MDTPGVIASIASMLDVALMGGAALQARFKDRKISDIDFCYFGDQAQLDSVCIGIGLKKVGVVERCCHSVVRFSSDEMAFDFVCEKDKRVFDSIRKNRTPVEFMGVMVPCISNEDFVINKIRMDREDAGSGMYPSDKMDVAIALSESDFTTVHEMSHELGLEERLQDVLRDY